MKRSILTLFVFSAWLTSCSSDKNENAEENSIVGTWQATELKASDPNSDQVDLGAEILAKLTAEECYILTFTFQQDLTLKVESGVNHLEINATATGLNVPCPTQMDTESTTYTYDGTTLTYVDLEMGQMTVKVSVEGNSMSIDAADLDIPNFNGSGQLIFKRK